MEWGEEESERTCRSDRNWRLSRTGMSRALLMGRLAVPRPLGNAALAQFILLHLTALGGRQLVHELEISRDREIGQARLAKGNQLSFRESLAWMKDDSRWCWCSGPMAA